MKAKDALKIIQEKMLRRDLTPEQCRAGRAIVGWDVYDLSDVSRVDAVDIIDFENRHERDNLNLCDRYQISEAFRVVGIEFSRTKKGFAIRFPDSLEGLCQPDAGRA